MITLQNFWGFAFIIDDGNQLRDTDRDNDKRVILEGRTVAAFGISNTNINQTNRKTMRTWIGKTSKVFAPYGSNYDKGHFIAHGFGGPIDVNLFPQRRDINRGWYEVGEPYRQMERYVAANPVRSYFPGLSITTIHFALTDLNLDIVLQIFSLLSNNSLIGSLLPY